MKFVILAICVAVVAAKPHLYLYNGPAAVPIGSDGRVIDVPEVAQLQEIPTFIMADPILARVSQGYSGPPAPIGQDGRVVDTEEVSKLKAEHLVALTEAQAKAAASAATSSSPSSSDGYIYEVPPVQYSETFSTPKPLYIGHPAPIGENGHVDDTNEVAKLQAENVATSENANAAPASSAAAPGDSVSSSKGYTYNILVIQQIPTYAVDTPVIKPQQVYNGPPAPLGEDGGVIDTEEVAKLPAEHHAAFVEANAADAAFASASGYVVSSPEGYTYNVPVVQQTQNYAIETPVIMPQQVYNGPPAPLGEDGRVIDTEEVAKLNAEHLATLEKANAAAAAAAAASGASMCTCTSKVCTYKAPEVPHTQTFAVETPVIKPQQVYNGPPAPLGEDGRVINTEEVAKLPTEHRAALVETNAAEAAFASASGYAVSSPEVYTYNVPAVQQTQNYAIETPVIMSQQVYNGPPAPLGEDGRVIDTEEVAKLKAEHLAALDQANAAAAAFAAASGSSISTFSSEGDTYAGPVVQHTQRNNADMDAPAVPRPQKTYDGPLAHQSADGKVVDTNEVAQRKTQRLATIAQANAKAETSAATASSSLSSSVEILYGAPVVRQVQTFVTAAPIAKPSTYNGPAAPLSETGRVVDTDEVARLKAQRLATLAEATSKAIADAAAEAAKKPEADVHSPPLPSVQRLSNFAAPVAEIKRPHVLVQRVIRRRPAHAGPFAPLRANGH